MGWYWKVKVKYEITWLRKIMNECGKRPLFAEIFLKKTALNTSSTIQETLRVLRTFPLSDGGYYALRQQSLLITLCIKWFSRIEMTAHFKNCIWPFTHHYGYRPTEKLEEMVVYKSVYKWTTKAQVIGIFNALHWCLFGEGEQYVSENGRQWTRYRPI